MYEGILSMRQPASASKFNVIGMIDDWGLLTLCTTPPLFGHLLEHQSILTLHPSELGIAWRISCPKQRQRNTIGFDVNLLSDQDHTESNLPSDQISKTRYGGRGRTHGFGQWLNYYTLLKQRNRQKFVAAVKMYNLQVHRSAGVILVSNSLATRKKEPLTRLPIMTIYIFKL